MIKKILNKAIPGFIPAGFLVLILAAGCQDNDDLGFSLTTPGERFHYRVDTLTTISAFTYSQDSVTSDKRSSALIGCLNDPLFGRSTASLFAQIRLTSNDVEFGEEAQIDSLVLLLKYQSFYGDTTTPQRIRVFEMTDDLYFDSTYYSNLKTEGFYDPINPIADFTYLPQPQKDSVLIRLSDETGLKILTADTSHLSGNTSFLEFFKGLYLQAQPMDETGSIIYYDLAGGKSRVTLYYHNSEQDSLKYELTINSNSTWVNLFDHDYSGAGVEPYINDTMSSHNRIYLQAMSGLRGYLKINLSDQMTSLINSGIAINKAELILTTDDSDPGIFSPPKSLRVFNANKDGTNAFIKDLLLGEDYYGGQITADNREFRFNIGRYLQDISYPVAEKRLENTGLFLVLSDERTSANRLVLKTGAEAVKLVLTYTTIN